MPGGGEARCAWHAVLLWFLQSLLVQNQNPRDKLQVWFRMHSRRLLLCACKVVFPLRFFGTFLLFNQCMCDASFYACHGTFFASRVCHQARMHASLSIDLCSPSGSQKMAGSISAPCKFGIKCTQGNCKFAHPSKALKCQGQGQVTLISQILHHFLTMPRLCTTVVFCVILSSHVMNIL